jgi:hypothetical protein
VIYTKLQRLDEGDMSVDDYFVELQKGMICAGVHEETEDKICHFYFGLRTEIQDFVNYKEENTVNHLFQLAMLAKKELQGHQTMKTKTSFTPHSTPTAPCRTATPSGARSSTTPLASRALSTSSTPSTAAPTLRTRVRLLFCGEQQWQSLRHPQFLSGAHRTLSATVVMVLTTSSGTAPTRNPTLLQLTEVM